MKLIALSHWMLYKPKHESSIVLLIFFWIILTFHELEIVAIRQSVALVFVSADSGEDYITVDGNEGDR